MLYCYVDLLVDYDDMLIITIFFFFLMIRRPPRSTRTDTLFPYTTLFRSLEKIIPARIQRFEIARAQSVNLAPVRATAMVAENRFGTGKVFAIVHALILVHRDRGGVAAVERRQPDVVAFHVTVFDREVHLDLLALDEIGKFAQRARAVFGRHFV